MSALSYLKNLDENYKKEEKEIKEELESLKAKEEKNTEVIKTLEKSQDSFYESFIPRDIHADEKKKMEELSAQQQQMENREKELTARLKVVQEKTKELSEVITEEEMQNKAEKEKEVERIEKIQTMPVQELENVLHRIELCARLIDIDPLRCRLEMSTVLKMLSNTIEAGKES